MTEVEVANQALSILGISNVITDLDDESIDAANCKRFLSSAVDAVLRAFTFNGTVFKKQVLSSEASEFGGTYLYKLPADCVRAYRVNGCNGEFPVVLNSMNDACIEHRDASGINLEYVKRIPVSKLRNHVGLAVAYRLAEMICGPSAGKRTIEFQQAAIRAVSDAIAQDRMEKGPETPDIIGAGFMGSSRDGGFYT